MKSFDAGNNLLPAIAYGDACGLPFETRPANPEVVISGLSSIKANDYLDIPVELKGKTGIWSDDTHLSLATTLSLLNSSGFDLDDIAKHHVVAIDNVRGLRADSDFTPPIVTESKRNGYGKSTIESIDRIAEGVDPRVSGNKNGTGNGVLIKMAPLVLWALANGSSEITDDNIVEYTKMTHAATETVVASLVHRNVLESLYYETLEDKQVYDYAFEEAIRYENKFDEQKRAVSNVLGRFIGRRITHKEIIDRLDDKGRGGLYAPETLMMAYGSFYLESNFPDSVYRAVELGGDTDSVASIVGAMSVFKDGKVDFPKDIEEVFAIDRIRRISAKLARLITKEGE